MSFLLAEEKALKSSLEGLTVSDLGSAVRPVDVRFRFPEEEPTSDQYPFITLDLVSVERAPSREHRGMVNPDYLPDEAGWAYDTTGVNSTMIEFPIPVDLIFTISSYARKAFHSRQIAAGLIRGVLNTRNFSLTIPEDSTKRRVFNMGGMPTENSRDVNGKRLFRQTFVVKVESELVPDQYQAAVAQTVNIDIQPI